MIKCHSCNINRFYDVLANASGTRLPAPDWEHRLRPDVTLQPRIVWTFNVKAEKRRRQSKFRQMSRIEKEQKLVVLLVNQIAGKQPKRRALLRTQPLTDPPVIQPDAARHSWTLCQASTRPRAIEEESGPTPRAARRVISSKGSLLPSAATGVQMALSTAAVSTHYCLITGCSRSKPTHSLGCCVFTPLSRRREKQGRGCREMRLVPVSRPSGRRPRPPRHISGGHVGGFHYWRPLLCLNHNGGDSACQWEPRRHAARLAVARTDVWRPRASAACSQS